MTHFLFNVHKLNKHQTHETASQLYATLEELARPTNQFFDNDDAYHHHLIGKLMFFINLYKDMHNELFINETVVCDNYMQFARNLCAKYGYTTNAMADACEDYTTFILEQLEDILDLLDTNNISIDDVIEHVNGYEQFNFQELQFIADCCYATYKDYKIMRMVDGKYQDEVDYECIRRTVAINQYCDEFNCNHEDLLVQEIFDDKMEYTAGEFFEFLVQNNIDDMDFVLDYDGLRTINDWLIYVINTMLDVNLVLIREQDFNAAQNTVNLVDKLTKLLETMNY